MPGGALTIVQAGLGLPSISQDYCSLTIIVPTLNEAESLPRLLSSLADRYPGSHVIVADDDSVDETRELAESFRGPLKVRVLHRRKAVRGLTASVVDALKLVETPYFVVMDADLQHPPAAVQAILAHASNGAHFAVGRRTSDRTFTTGRRALSRGAQVLARSYLRTKGVRRIHDPMSGFFGGKTRFARKILDEHEADFEKPGFKVLVDFLRFAPRGTKVEEVPYPFGARAAGSSKLRGRHALSFLRQLGLLGRAAASVVDAARSPTFWKFAAVGASGAVVNSLFLFAGVQFGLPLLLASALAIEAAVLWNFLGNDRWSFFGRGRSVPRSQRLVRYHVQSGLGALVNLILLSLLTTGVGLTYLLANLVGMAGATLVNWSFSSNWTWPDRPASDAQASP